MKTEGEIQKAHDILMLIGEMDVGHLPLSEDRKLALRAAASILCWVLEHPHNPEFGAILSNLDRELLKAGVCIETKPVKIYLDKAMRSHCQIAKNLELAEEIRLLQLLIFRLSCDRNARKRSA